MAICMVQENEREITGVIRGESRGPSALGYYRHRELVADTKFFHQSLLTVCPKRSTLVSKPFLAGRRRFWRKAGGVSPNGYRVARGLPVDGILDNG